MHYKFSSIIVQVTVSFMYGMMLPVLFPITLMGIINMYMIEKLTIAYYYQEPPKYDNKLIEIASWYLQRAPIIMFIFGYWAMTNPQMFCNITPKFDNQTEVWDPEHSIFDNDSYHQWLILFQILMLWSAARGTFVRKMLVKFNVLQEENVFNKQITVCQEKHFFSSLSYQ